MAVKWGMDVNGWMLIVYAVAAAVASVAIGIAAFKSGRPIRSMAGSAVQGACALAAVNVAGAFTGTSLGVGVFSIVCCVIGGIPGVIALLLIKLIAGI